MGGLNAGSEGAGHRVLETLQTKFIFRDTPSEFWSSIDIMKSLKTVSYPYLL